MTKAQLEELLQEYYEKYSKLHNEFRELRNNMKDMVSKDEIDHIKETQYQDWKSQNSVFLERFIKEYLTENMRIYTSDSGDYYSNYTNISLVLEGKAISEDSFSNN